MKQQRSAVGTALLIYIMALFLFSLTANAQENKASDAKATAATAQEANKPEAAPSTNTQPAVPTTSAKAKAIKTKKRYRKVFAVITFEQGGKVLKPDVKIRLFEKKAPKTVASFVDLSEGKIEFLDPKTKKMVTRPFYDGLTIHRVVPGFVIQGGDPLGNGRGRPRPDYKVDDEISPDLKHDKPGVVAMANAGPNTAGSQFYITLAPATFLDNGPTRYTIFGQVVEGMSVVEKIGKTRTGPDAHPLVPVIMKKVTIVRE